ncbi:hypothetical protein ACLHZ2_20015 [Aeromonas media]|uniref:hypothetical protein n=1 Tax=Aeromonas media TaxID=651 RepID=UPI003CFD9F00
MSLREVFPIFGVLGLLIPLCLAHYLGFEITIVGFIAALVASPLLGFGLMVGMISFADWSERRARARRIARAKARKGEGA